MTATTTEEKFYCRFCDKPDPERILADTSEFYVQLSLGPLTEGHLLIISHDHYSCSADLPASRQQSLWRLTGVVRDVVAKVYGPGVLFEHGRSGACLPPGHGDDHCYHLHIHCVPLNVLMATRISIDYSVRRIADWSELQAVYLSNGEPYLAFEDGSGVYYVRNPEDLPRHYLRTVVAEATGRTELADWVAFPSYPVISTAIERLGGLVKSEVESVNL